MAEIKLTPTGHLCWMSDGEPSLALAALQKVFEQDWRKGLFILAADKTDVASSTSLRYWQMIAAHYVTELCHIPESEEAITVPQPGAAEFANWLLTAPPMIGAEYLSEDILRALWSALDQWVQKEIATIGSLKTFLQSETPKWHQVGRVCFHLAENKADETHPFAFLATYSTGFGTGGKLKHLPLRTALEQYAGTKNRLTLINLLSPVQQAASQVPWVSGLVDSGEIYQPLAWKPETAYQFLRSIPTLEEAGLVVRMPNWQQCAPPLALATSIQME